MSEQPSTPMLPPPSGVSEWISVWRDALTKPNEQTYSRIALSPNAKVTTALLWVFLGSLVNYLLSLPAQGVMMRRMMQNYDFGGQEIPNFVGNGLLTAVCGAPVWAVVQVILFAAIVGVVQLIAKMFGGRGTFDQLAYAIAAIVTPFYLVGGLLGLLSAIPSVGFCFGILGFLAALYVLVLEMMAVKGVNQFGWGQAAASLLLPFLALCCCLSVGVFAFVQAISTQMPDIFNQFLTPVP
jgi:hypothetical protein